MVVPQKCIIIALTIFFSLCLERMRAGKTKFSETLSIDETGTISNLEFTEPGFSLTDAEIKKFKMWSNGIIPYYIDEYSFDKVLRDKLRLFLDSVNSNTGLKFLELPSPVDDDKTRWLFFVNRNGLLECDDNIHNKMTNEGIQTIFLGYDCINSGKALAALVLGIVGVPPQHNAPNRDQYIEVHFNNILPEKAELFKKLKSTDWIFHDVGYDFASASHSDFFEHSINGGATITSVSPIEESLLEGDSFSFGDIWKIRMLYNFILRKRKDRDQAPNCQKIFQPGKNFKSYKPASEEDIKPRSKPKAYTGGKNGKNENLSDSESIDEKSEEKKSKEILIDIDSTDEKSEKLSENESNDGNSEEKRSKEKVTDNDSADGKNVKPSDNYSIDEKSEGNRSKDKLTDNDSDDRKKSVQSADSSTKSQEGIEMDNGESKNKIKLNLEEIKDDYSGEIDNLRGFQGTDPLTFLSDIASSE